MGIEGMEQSEMVPQPDASAATSPPRLARRAAIGRIAAGGAVGLAAWVVPQILTAEPSAAALSGGGTGGTGTGPGGGTGGTGTAAGTAPSGPPPVTSSATTGAGSPTLAASSTAQTPAAAPASADPPQLAATGLDLQGQAEIGALMAAAGWVVHRWASRVPSDPAPGQPRSPWSGP